MYKIIQIRTKLPINKYTSNQPDRINWINFFHFFTLHPILTCLPIHEYYYKVLNVDVDENIKIQFYRKVDRNIDKISVSIDIFKNIIKIKKIITNFELNKKNKHFTLNKI